MYVVKFFFLKCQIIIYESGTHVKNSTRNIPVSDEPMSTIFPNPISPYSGWERLEYRVSRPLTEEDVAAFLGNEELYVRETPAGTINIIHKYGLLELHCIIGEPKIEIWFNPKNGAYPTEYLDALLSTRFT